MMVVPPGEFTTSGTGVGLGACGGVTAVNELLPSTVMLSGSPPRVAVSPDGVVVGRLLPNTVIVVPPCAGPEVGQTLPTETRVPIEYWPAEVVCASNWPVELFVE